MKMTDAVRKRRGAAGASRLTYRAESRDVVVKPLDEGASRDAAGGCSLADAADDLSGSRDEHPVKCARTNAAHISCTASNSREQHVRDQPATGA